jgi:hypothetical protein
MNVADKNGALVAGEESDQGLQETGQVTRRSTAQSISK